MLKGVIERLKQQKITLTVDETAKELIAKQGTDVTYGARPLRRAIQNLLEDKLAEEILDGKLKENSKATVKAKEDKIVIE